jgi:hypothetical protein
LLVKIDSQVQSETAEEGVDSALQSLDQAFLEHGQEKGAADVDGRLGASVSFDWLGGDEGR